MRRVSQHPQPSQIPSTRRFIMPSFSKFFRLKTKTPRIVTHDGFKGRLENTCI